MNLGTNPKRTTEHLTLFGAVGVRQRPFRDTGPARSARSSATPVEKLLVVFRQYFIFRVRHRRPFPVRVVYATTVAVGRPLYFLVLFYTTSAHIVFATHVFVPRIFRSRFYSHIARIHSKRVYTHSVRRTK